MGASAMRKFGVPPDKVVRLFTTYEEKTPSYGFTAAMRAKHKCGRMGNVEKRGEENGFPEE